MKKICEFCFNKGLLWFTIGAFIWIIVHWGFLNGKYIFSHDSYYWYPIFHYFTESLQRGFIPIWNPYIHGGEIFFTNTGMWSLIDPVSIVCIFMGKIFGIKNLFYLYELTIFAKLIVIATGVQLLLNMLVPEIKKYWYFTFFVVLLSSFSINCYHQNAVSLVFSYIPFVLIFFIRFLKNSSWFNSIMLGYFTGICFQSMHFFFHATFILLFITVYLIFNKQSFSIIFNNKLKLFCSFLVFIAISAPAWSIIFYKPLIYPYARSLFNPISENPPFFFSNVGEFKNSQAAFGEIGDFLGLGFFPIAKGLYTTNIYYTFLSELSMFIAVIPFILGIIGIFKGKHELKKVFFILLFLSGVLFLGPRDFNIIYKFLFYIIPPLRGLENTHEFVNYFLLCYFYFVSLGLVFILQKFKKQWLIPLLFIITLFELSLYVRQIYNENFFTCAVKTSNIAGINFDSTTDFRITPRKKTIMPAYIGLIETSERFKDFFIINPTYKDRLNFRAFLEKESVATDFFSNFPAYEYLKIYPPTALTYPKLYTDILKANMPTELKAVLLGVNLPIFSFYSDYKSMPAEELIKEENNKQILDDLSKTVILSGVFPDIDNKPKNNFKNKIDILDYKPHHIKLAVNTEQDGVLLFRDGYHPSWKAKVDNISKNVIQANYNSKAVFISKGNHIVEFIFNPIIFNIALYLYFLGSISLIFVFLIYKFKQASKINI
ncbi:MAG: hypothetical protein V2B14_05715 [bacterium]